MNAFWDFTDESPYITEKRAAAIDYLKSRKKWLGQPKCKFEPTTSAATDVAKTFAELPEDAKKPRGFKVVKK